MKKILVFVIIVMMFIPLLSGCSDDSIVEIDERVFLTMVTHIRRNADDYVGRTVHFEGMFQNFYWPATGPFSMVNRNTWGCCGEDGSIGFDVYLGDMEPLPDNTWVEVYGTFEWYEVVMDFSGDDGGDSEREPLRILRVNVESITELEERGLEFVNQ
ncbi:MAG: hypothetical protein FWD05_05400 [Oscillospiraceae bacterium]|nr:hypothetical protein [Oscillospiraceae bacterium]